MGYRRASLENPQTSASVGNDWVALARVETRGYAKRTDHYWHHGQRKIVFVRPLAPSAVASLVAPFSPPLQSIGKETTTSMEMTIDVNALPIEGEGGLIGLLRTI